MARKSNTLKTIRIYFEQSDELKVIDTNEDVSVSLQVGGLEKTLSVVDGKFQLRTKKVGVVKDRLV